MARLEPLVIEYSFLAKRLGTELDIDREYRFRIPRSKFYRQLLFSTYRDHTSKDEVKSLFRNKPVSESLFMNTSGLYHHLTYGRLTQLSDEVCYIHIDNHADSQDMEEKRPENVSHASFVPDIEKLDNVKDILLIGPESEKYRAIQPALGELENTLEEVTDKVYISLDMDVLSEDHITTPFKQGSTTMKELEELLTAIHREKDVVGADMVGLERPVKARSIETCRRCAQLLSNTELEEPI